MRKELLGTEVGVDRIQIRSEGGSRSRLQSPETSRGKSGLSRDGTWPHLACSSFTLPSQASLLNVPSCPSCPTLPVPPGGGSPAEPVRVLGLFHEELHGPGPLGALSILAQTEVTLSGTMGQASAHILSRRPRQRPAHQVRRTPGKPGREVGVTQKGSKRAEVRERFPMCHRPIITLPESSPRLPREVDAFILPIEQRGGGLPRVPDSKR